MTSEFKCPKYCIVYTVNSYPRGTNFGVFRSTAHRFRDTKVVNSQKCTECSQIYPTHLNVKYSIHTKYLSPRHKYWLVLFYDQPTSKIQGCQKSEMHQMTTEWPWALKSQKVSYTQQVNTPKPKLWSIWLYDQPFLTYIFKNLTAHFIYKDAPLIYFSQDAF